MSFYPNIGRPTHEKRPQLHAHIMAGGTPKWFACENGMTNESVSGLVRALGFRKYYLTYAEYQQVMEQRKGVQVLCA